MLDYFENFLKHYSLPGLEISDVEILNNTKLVASLTYDDKMASFELLKDGTCDILIIHAPSEQLLFSETQQIESIDDLKRYIDNFLEQRLLNGS